MTCSLVVESWVILLSSIGRDRGFGGLGALLLLVALIAAIIFYHSCNPIMGSAEVVESTGLLDELLRTPEA